MLIRRGAMALCLGVMVLSATLVAQNDARKLTDEQKREIQAVIKIVDDAMAGKPAPNELALAWTRHDELKGPANKQVRSVHRHDRSVEDLQQYPHGLLAGCGKAGCHHRLRQPRRPRPRPSRTRLRLPYMPTRILNSASVSKKDAPLQISRAFVVQPGSYDVHIVIKEPSSNRGKARRSQSLVPDAHAGGAEFLGRGAEHELGHRGAADRIRCPPR